MFNDILGQESGIGLFGWVFVGCLEGWLVSIVTRVKQVSRAIGYNSCTGISVAYKLYSCAQGKSTQPICLNCTQWLRCPVNSPTIAVGIKTWSEVVPKCV